MFPTREELIGSVRNAIAECDEVIAGSPALNRPLRSLDEAIADVTRRLTLVRKSGDEVREGRLRDMLRSLEAERKEKNIAGFLPMVARLPIYGEVYANGRIHAPFIEDELENYHDLIRTARRLVAR